MKIVDERATQKKTTASKKQSKTRKSKEEHKIE